MIKFEGKKVFLFVYFVFFGFYHFMKPHISQFRLVAKYRNANLALFNACYLTGKV